MAEWAGFAGSYFLAPDKHVVLARRVGDDDVGIVRRDRACVAANRRPFCRQREVVRCAVPANSTSNRVSPRWDFDPKSFETRVIGRLEPKRCGRCLVRQTDMNSPIPVPTRVALRSNVHVGEMG